MIAAGLSGVTFGLGLALSGMLDPQRVRGFLDIFGDWDPSLAFVLGGAVAVASVGVQIARRMNRPAFDDDFHLPATRPIDGKLIAGAAMFGVGWGMAGLCPGPAVASISLGVPKTLVFLAAMLAGMAMHDRNSFRPFSRGRMAHH
ncbi:YeeE/YedE family protein [Methylopila jiangsuensis]|jgi:uncharacterized membrane protein YedE/YeeE|nr:YeeE/YedE family protein [Methylopila jiangsuensis]